MENKPLNLGDILEKVFVISRKSLSRNIIVASIIMLPGAIILAIGMNYFFTRLFEFTLNVNPNYGFTFDPYEIAKFIIAYIATLFGASLLHLAGYLGTTQVFQKQYRGIKATVREAFEIMFSSKLVELIIFSIFISAAIVTLFAIPAIFLVIGSSMDLVVLSIFAGFLLFSIILILIYFSVKWILLIPTMLIEDLGVFEALKRSSALVKFYWWRTLGIYLLISFIVNIALSIITTPFSLLIFLDFIISIVSSASSINQNFNDPYFLLNYFSGFGYKIGVLAWVTYIAQLCILPCLQVVIYFDLKARNNENIDKTDSEDYE